VPFLPKCVLLSDSGDIADQYWISGLVVETITASITPGMIMPKPKFRYAGIFLAVGKLYH